MKTWASTHTWDVIQKIVKKVLTNSQHHAIINYKLKKGIFIMIKILLEDVEDEAREFLELTEDQFRLLHRLKDYGWMGEHVNYVIFNKELEFEKV